MRRPLSPPLIERMPVLDLRNKYQLQPRIFYTRQQQFFKNGTAVFAQYKAPMRKETQQKGTSLFPSVPKFHPKVCIAAPALQGAGACRWLLIAAYGSDGVGARPGRDRGRGHGCKHPILANRVLREVVAIVVRHVGVVA